jgi:hypothetical protein
LVLNTSKNCLVDPFLLQREKHQPPNQKVEFQDIFEILVKSLSTAKRSMYHLKRQKSTPTKKVLGDYLGARSS